LSSRSGMATAPYASNSFEMWWPQVSLATVKSNLHRKNVKLFFLISLFPSGVCLHDKCHSQFCVTYFLCLTETMADARRTHQSFASDVHFIFSTMKATFSYTYSILKKISQNKKKPPIHIAGNCVWLLAKILGKERG
jgi:hypothetical protein